MLHDLAVRIRTSAVHPTAASRGYPPLFVLPEPIRAEYLEIPATISTTGPGPQPTAARSFPVRSPPAAWRLTSLSNLHHLLFVDRFLWSFGCVPFATPADDFVISYDRRQFVKILRHQRCNAAAAVAPQRQQCHGEVVVDPAWSCSDGPAYTERPSITPAHVPIRHTTTITTT